MTDHCPSLVEPAEHLPAEATDRFGGRDARQRLELVVPRVDAEVRCERHQRVAREKDVGHPGNIRREKKAGFPWRRSGIRAEVLRVWLGLPAVVIRAESGCSTLAMPGAGCGRSVGGSPREVLR